MNSNLVPKVKVPVTAPFHHHVHQLQQDFVRRYVIMPNAIYIGAHDWYELLKSDLFHLKHADMKNLRYMGMEVIRVEGYRHLSVGLVMRRQEIDDYENGHCPREEDGE
jgi:hypothetical protein